MTADLVARLEADANEIVTDWHRSMGLPLPNTGSVRQRVDLLREAASALRSSGEAVGERRAPVQGYGEGTIPWSIHCLAWEAYAKKYGKQQTAERLAQRGGFGVEEMDMFLPGWRGMAHAIDHPATPASAWRPIAEAPRDGTAVILGAEGHEPVRARWGWEAPWIDGWWCDGHRSDAEGPGFEPTHFQPLPTPPTSTSQPAASAALERV